MNNPTFEWHLTSPGYEFRARCEATLNGECLEMTVGEKHYKEDKAGIEQTLAGMFDYVKGIEG